MRKKSSILFVIILSIASSILLIFGFIQGTSAVLKPKNFEPSAVKKETTPNSSKKENGLRIVALGDSLTRGVGDDNGEGYVKRLTNKLTNQFKKKVLLSNLSVSGAKTGDLVTLLKEPGTGHVIKQADLIVMTIGGNDLFPGVQTLEQNNLQSYQPDFKTFQTNSRTIIDSIRKDNADVPIYWISLYNPFEDITELGDTSSFVINWNYQMEKLAAQYSNLYIIPVFDLFQGRSNEFVYTDHFHPNKKGYEVISERVYQSIISHEQIGGSEQ